LVADGQSGYLVAPGKSTDAADRLLELRQDSDLRRRMGEQGEGIVHASFSLNQNVRQLLECYDLS